MTARLDDIEARANTPGPRIERVEAEGGIVWIKRPERLSLRMRLQKGDPAAAFTEEVATHVEFFERGLPVAPVVLASGTALVTRDCGPNLRALAWAGDARFPEGLAAGARALAQLHAAGVQHGRPSLKDICFSEGQIAFLDLERSGRGNSSDQAAAFDLLILIFSTAVETGSDRAAMVTARDAYLEAGSADIWGQARRRARLFAPLGWLLWPVTKALRGNREFDAIAPFFRFMRS